MSTRAQPNWRERLMQSITKTDAGCWEWNGCKDAKGYGRVFYKGKSWRAYRAFYEEFNGHLERNQCVLHVCDNPPCCNPEHLLCGTRADNNADKARKGRGGRKIDAATARAILSASGTQQQIANEFGVSRPMVSLIKNGKCWSEAI